MDIRDGVREGKKTKKEPCRFLFSINSLFGCTCIGENTPNLEDNSDKPEDRLLCYCIAADISVGRQMGN